jgi:SAM-dependent methyltransferase
LEAWTTGRDYESYVGRWSRGIAPEFVDWLALEPGAGWLDVGCGTGALSSAIVERAAPSRVVGVDPSIGFLSYAVERRAPARGAVADAHALPLVEAAFDACVSGLVLNFLGDPPRAVGEMGRVVRPGGTVAAYVWDYAEGMQLLRLFWDAVVRLDPDAAELDEGRRFPLANPDALAGLFHEAGLSQVESRGIELETRFASFDDLWSPFLGGQGPAPGYVATLNDERRVELAEELSANLPVAEDASITLRARAWAVRGRSGSESRSFLSGGRGT